MSWFDFLKRGDKKPPLPPIRTVQKPGEARRERQARETEEVPVPVDDSEKDFLDTGSLEMAREAGDGDNPYDTQTWQVDTPQGPRRVDDLKAVNKERKSGEEDNPYDTVVTRKGW
ncbi:MAG: hypothetical protein ACE5G3_07005 [Gammaproteobacteria bacterium]